MPHQWITFRLGRICTECSIIQEKGKFSDDESPCPKDKAYREGEAESRPRKRETEEAR